jgi:uncharacterized protein (DUF983 family)
VIDTVPANRAGLRLMELASDEICSARCTHCGATNLFRGFTAIEAFTCQECGGASASNRLCSDGPHFVSA